MYLWIEPYLNILGDPSEREASQQLHELQTDKFHFQTVANTDLFPGSPQDVKLDPRTQAQPEESLAAVI